ncbi:MAG TPA: hypothetical protein VNG33_11880 [Polyangiaceae bacterium]|nr:hypothetical protein [Polyangiaceae bacterium]
MSGRGPDPKDLRASLVDSGWSVAPPPAEPLEIRAPGADAAAGDDHEPEDPSTRRLPNYDDLAQAPAVTQIDTDIQARLQQMQRASVPDAQRPALPTLPPPPPSRPPPPSLPPPPPLAVALAAGSDAPLPSFRTPSGPDAEAETEAELETPAAAADYLPPPRNYVPAPPNFVPPLRNSDSEPAESTEIMERGLPPSDPPELRGPPMHLLSMPAAPSLLAALRQRVRFAGGELPLWSLLTPMVLLLVLGAGFVAAALGRPDDSAPGAAPSPSASPAAAAPSALTSAADATPEAPATTQAPALPATSIDTEALEARRAEELTKDEALKLAAGRRQREVARVAQLRQKLARDPGLFKDAATLADLRRAAEDPLTAPDALSAMAEAPGPLSADLLYEMWTGTVVRNGATELARSLVFSKEVRAKASAELAIALDLRIAETCEQNKALLSRVADKGDRRSLALLAKLSRRFGCGANKHLDCYACLRDDKAVDDAMTAVKKRREPKPFLGK